MRANDSEGRSLVKMGKLVICCALLVGFLPAISASFLSGALRGAPSGRELTAKFLEH